MGMKEVIMQVQSFSADYPKSSIYIGDLVRCKDCRFNKYPSNDLCLIKKAGIYPDDDDFCSYGERREPCY